MYRDVGIAEQQKVRKQASRDDGIKQFSIATTPYIIIFLVIHVLCGKICKMGLYTALCCHPCLFPHFLLFCFPYISTGFYTCNYIESGVHSAHSLHHYAFLIESNRLYIILFVCVGATS